MKKKTPKADQDRILLNSFLCEFEMIFETLYNDVERLKAVVFPKLPPAKCGRPKK